MSTTVALPSSARSRATESRSSPGSEAGVTEAMIEAVVHRFYADVRRDPALGPIFERAIGSEWEAHLRKLADFWSSVLLMSGRFKGAPMAAHATLPEVGPAHFARWLELFRATAGQVCPEPAAALFIAKAEMIARSLQLGIAASRGELPPVSPALSGHRQHKPAKVIAEGSRDAA